MAKTIDKPLVTIGLIVYNEGRFIGDTIDSLLAQDYENLEIICCDNCSTDNSDDICRTAADADERVRYVRHDKNIGAPANSVGPNPRVTSCPFGKNVAMSSTR